MAVERARRRAALLALGLSASCVAAPAGFEMKSYVSVNGKVQAAFAWCDAPGAVVTLTAPVGPGPGEDGPLRSELLFWKKARTGLGTPSRQPVTLGQPDAGAGQVYTPLRSQAGQTLGQLQTSNIENTSDPAYHMTKTGEFKLGNDVFRCRYVKDAAFVGVTGKRTVIVWDNGKTATYATRNFDGSAGVYVTSGKRVSPGIEGGIHYEFPARGGFTYFVNIDPNGPLTGAGVVVRKGGVLFPDERFVTYSVSVPRKPRN